MRAKRLPKSARKFLRGEKARIRREIFALREAEEKIHQLVEEIYKRYNKAKPLKSDANTLMHANDANS